MKLAWLMGTASIVAIAPLACQAQTANSNGEAPLVAEVIVTGTSIRGEQPVGSDLISISRQDILATGAANTQEVLRKVPQLNGFNTQIRPTLNGGTGVATPPGLRGLNANATLILLDGQRLIGENPLASVPDPSSIPAAAIERVEVVADGASAIYGSDAVAGVINIITRKNLDGFETSIRKGFGQYGYDALDLSQALGRTWTGGSAMIVASYYENSHLANYDLPYFTDDLRPFGGSDQRTTACLPPNVTIGGVTYVGPAYSAGPAARCQYGLADAAPDYQRTSILGNVRQQVTDDLSVWGQAKYTATYLKALGPNQGTTANVTIPSNNPFFFRPTGAVGETASVSVVLFPITGLISNRSKAKSLTAVMGADYRLPHDFNLTATFNYGDGRNVSHSPSINSALLAAAARATTPATALDPFGTRTDPSVARGIANFENLFRSTQKLYDTQAKIDGPLFSLPGGDLKVAAGVDWRRYTYDALNTVGPVGQLVSPGISDAARSIKAIFGEVLVPIVGPDNAMPLVKALTVSAAVRHDDYSDFGKTTNPKVGVTWQPVQDLTLRASYGTSFHAPDMGDSYAVDTRANYLVNFPLLVPPGRPAGDVLILAGGNQGLKPEEAKTYSVGGEFRPDWLPGFSASLTYWNIKYTNLIRTPPISQEVYTNPAFAQFVVFNPTRAFLDTIATQFRVVNTTTPIPLVPYFIDLRRQNLGAVNTDGIDYAIDYRWISDLGQFAVGLAGSRSFDFLLRGSAGAPFVSQNNFIKTRWRVEGSWNKGALSANAAYNYSGRYNQTYGTTAGPTAEQSVAPFKTVDLRAAYDLPDRYWLGGTRLSVSIDNVFDKDPPRLFVTPGYSALASFVGRMTWIGLERRW